MLTLAPAAYGQVYKCKMANGQTEYKDKPCAGSSKDYAVYANDKVSREEVEAARQIQQRLKAHSLTLGAQNGAYSSTGSSVSLGTGSGTIRRSCGR
jgi:hypothetical protein